MVSSLKPRPPFDEVGLKAMSLIMTLAVGVVLFSVLKWGKKKKKSINNTKRNANNQGGAKRDAMGPNGLPLYILVDSTIA